MNHVVKIILLAVGLNLILTARTIAGLPFLTDDPEPVDHQHWEAYLFGTDDDTGSAHTINAPAVELNYGVLPDTQLHLVVPMTTVAPDHGRAESGLGDLEFGVKYRFIHETNGWPQIGIFPMVELPTGESSRGLGNAQLPHRWCGPRNWPKLAALDPWVLGVLAQLRELIVAMEAQLQTLEAELVAWVGDGGACALG